MFRHSSEGIPGAFALDAPSEIANGVAREVIQNSWDAARALKENMEGAPSFEMTFEFKKLVGQDKTDFVKAAELSGHQTRISSIKGTAGKLGVGPRGEDCLDNLLDPEVPLRILVIKEKGATGMYGSWENLKGGGSLMRRALFSTGVSHKFDGGGSYGYGKAGLILSSDIRTIVAYTCFREEADDLQKTRRLLGVTYWGDHEIDDCSEWYTGYGTLSAGAEENSVTPFVNEQADDMATAMGLPKRNPEEPTDLGTTLLAIAPCLDASDLKRAIERSWWPAIVEGSFLVDIIDEDEEKVSLRPKLDPILQPFIKAWDIAKKTQTAKEGDWFGEPPASKKTKEAYKCSTIGQVALVTELDGWSYSENEEGVRHESMVALTRGPEMVVQYLANFRHRAPYIRGVYIADQSLDSVLRDAEPKEHNMWHAKANHNFTEKDGEIVKSVLTSIRKGVIDHHGKLRPPPPSADNINLRHFNNAIRKLMSGLGKGTQEPVADTRPIAIRVGESTLSEHDPGLITVEGGATYSLSKHYQGESAEVSLSLEYHFLEDQTKRGKVPGRIKKAPDGFSEDDTGAFKGTLSRDQTVDLDFISEPYNAAWTLRQTVNGKIQPTKKDDS